MSKKASKQQQMEVEEDEEDMGGMTFDFGEKWTNVNAYADFMKTLPPNIKKRVNALQGLDADVKSIKADAQRELNKLTADYYSTMAPVLAARKALISGECDPTDEDVTKGLASAQEKVDKKEEDGEKGGAIASATEEGDDVTAEEKDEASLEGQGLKSFWLRVLQHHVVISSFIEGHDEPALELLQDITIEPLTDQGPTGGDFRVNFHFPVDNGFFENTVLSKTFKMKTELDEETLDKAESTEIKWKNGKNLTKKLVKKVQKKKGRGKGETRTISKEEDCPSFFRFFNDDEEEGEQEEWLMLARVLMVKIVPKAIDYYIGEGADGSSDMEDDDDDNWDLGDDEEEDEDAPPMLVGDRGGKGGRGGYSGGGGRGGGRGGGKQQECKQQ